MPRLFFEPCAVVMADDGRAVGALRPVSTGGVAAGSALHLLDRVYCRKSGNRRAIFLCGRDNAMDDFLGYKGTDGIMHQNDVYRRR